MHQIFKYIQAHGTWSFALMIAIASPMLGPLAKLSVCYPVAFIMGTFCILFFGNVNRINFAMIVLILACAISILFGHPLPIFKSWLRLAYSILIFIVVSPLFSSQKLDVFRVRLYDWMMKLCVFVGVGSFFCYFAGINYMSTFYKSEFGTAGIFGGLTVQSMLLGPLAGMGCVTLIYRQLKQFFDDASFSYLDLFFSLACMGSVLLSASRGALASTMLATCYLFFMFLKDKPEKLLKVGICLILLSASMYPLMGHFTSGMIAKQQANQETGGTFSSRELLWNDRKQEFLDSPLHGVGFAAQRMISYPSSLRTGIIEPGTSYGAIFAMTGILGGIPFLYLFLMNIIKRPRTSLPKTATISPAQATLVFFSFHLITEGYVFAGGAPLGAIFWCTLGAADSYRHLK